MGGGKRENNTGTHRARMSRARTGCPLRVMVATVVSTTAGKGEELASLGSGFIRRSDQEKRGGEEGPRAAVRGAAGHSWGNGAQAGSRAGLSGARHSLSCMDVAYVAPTCPIHVVQDLGLGSPVWGGHMVSMGALVGKSRERHKCRFALLPKEIEPQRVRCGDTPSLFVKSSSTAMT